MESPLRSLRLLAYIALMCGLILLMSPSQIPVNEDFVIKVPTWSDVFSSTDSTAKAPDVTQFEKRLAELEKQEQKEVDTVVKVEKEPEIKVSTNPNDIAIEYPEGNPHVLDKFFESLKRSQNEELVRIVHYGDSQLEGDRITENLREKFQETFGGCGVGLTPILELKNMRSTLGQEASANWRKYQIYGNEPRKSKHGFYSLMGSYFRFGRELAEGQERESADSAWVRFKNTRYSNERNLKVEKMRLLYRAPDAGFKLTYSNGEEPTTKSISFTEDFSTYQIPLSGNIEKLKVGFSSLGSPEIYGFAFDCNAGVAVDNFAFRGSSGTEFTKINKAHLQKQIKALNVKLIIVQFGVNVIPSVVSDYGFYEKLMEKQLSYLKSLDEDLCILVVGVSDMARRHGGVLASYPNIKNVRSAQRRAAAKTGCAYWDLFSAMGGENSIIAWANAKQPLASKDYTHFSRKGAMVVGEMLFNEMMREYKRHRKRNAA